MLYFAKCFIPSQTFKDLQRVQIADTCSALSRVLFGWFSKIILDIYLKFYASKIPSDLPITVKQRCSILQLVQYSERLVSCALTWFPSFQVFTLNIVWFEILANVSCRTVDLITAWGGRVFPKQIHGFVEANIIIYLKHNIYCKFCPLCRSMRSIDKMTPVSS